MLHLAGLGIGSLCVDAQNLVKKPEDHRVRAIHRLGTHPALLRQQDLPVPLLDQIGIFDKTALQSLIALGMGLMVMAAVLPGGAPGWLDAKWLFVVAQLSYVLYLLHWPLIPGVLDFMHGIPGFSALAPGGQFLAFLPVFLAVCLAAALALHYAVEKPFLILKDMPRRREAPAKAAA